MRRKDAIKRIAKILHRHNKKRFEEFHKSPNQENDTQPNPKGFTLGKSSVAGPHFIGGDQ